MDSEHVIKTLARSVRMLEERVTELERAQERFQNITVFRNGVQVYEQLIIPRKSVSTLGGACDRLGELVQNTGDSNKLYVCVGTWSKVGSQ